METCFAARPDTFAWYATKGKFKPFRFQRHIGKAIAAGVGQGNARIIINGPPRHGKSLITTFWTPLWFLNIWPEKQVVMSSFGAALATKFGRDLRNELASNPDCGVTLSDDSTAANRWNTMQGGGMRGMGISGPYMGQGFHLGVISDFCRDWASAHSMTDSDALWEWYSGTFLNRAEPGASIIIDSTRWSVHDLCARLIKHEPERWTVLRFPALAEDNDILGRKLGEPLCPERYSVESYAEFQSYPAKWNALWQQRPDNYGAGRLYGHFDASNVDDTLRFNPALPLSAAFDFNIDPGSHVLLGQYDNRADLFTVFDEIHGPRLDVRAACRMLREKVQALRNTVRAPELHIFGDASGNSEWAGTSESCYDLVRLELGSLPHRIRVPAANPPVRERLDTVNEALRDTHSVRHVKVHPRCVRLIDDFENMQSDEHGLEDKRDHALSHSSSAFGYWCQFMRPLYRDHLKLRTGEFAFGGSGGRDNGGPNLNGGQVVDAPRVDVNPGVFISRAR